MNKKTIRKAETSKTRFLFLPFFCFLAFFGVLARPDLYGLDSYATWLFIRLGEEAPRLVFQDWALQLFSLLPDSLIVFKLVMFASFFFAVTTLFFLSLKCYGEKIAWKSLVLVLGLSPILLFEFAKFENELFCFPLLFVGFCFAFLGRNWLEQSIAFFAVGFAGLFWGGAYFFWLVLLPLVPLNFLGLVFVWQKFGSSLLSVFGNSAIESVSGLSFVMLFGWLACFPFIFLSRSWRLVVSFCLALGLGYLAPKFLVFLAPFVVIGVGLLLKKLPEKGLNPDYLVLGAVFLLFSFNIAVFMAPPTSFDWQNVDLVIQEQKNTGYPIKNDWSFGYWLKIKGIDTQSFGGGKNPNYQKIKKPYIALTEQNLKRIGCTRINGYESWARTATVYTCS